MPTLEERLKESPEDKHDRIEAKTVEMGITFTFAQYLEQMEAYLLQLEHRVKTLEQELESKNIEASG